MREAVPGTIGATGSQELHMPDSNDLIMWWGMVAAIIGAPDWKLVAYGWTVFLPATIAARNSVCTAAESPSTKMRGRTKSSGTRSTPLSQG